MKVKEKKVELIELFYDLIYVYAISKLTLLIEEPEGGIISPARFFRYFIVCFIILQAWLYFTNYVNRYGRWKWYEYALTAVNMTATVYMANTINGQWSSMASAFNMSMLVMLLCVAAMYFIQIRLRQQDIGAARNSFAILAVDCLLYLIAYIASVSGVGRFTLWIDALAVLVGAFLPFFIRGKFDASIISFPHLAERFELITIITFGEGVVGMTDYFDVRNFSMRPILVFAVILALFGCYVVQFHYLCNHHRTARALRLMFSHYFIVISMNLVTVAFKFLDNPESSRLFTAGLMSAAMAMFFISIFSDSVYYYDWLRFDRKDAAFSTIIIIIGSVAMAAGGVSVYLFLTGSLTAAGGNFLMLLAKYKRAETDSGVGE